MPSREHQESLRARAELDREPHWSQEQARWVESMQCRRPPELIEWIKPVVHVERREIVATAPCPMCGSVMDVCGNQVCDGCVADDRRDRAS